jgi:LacI family transcriptional regulator
MTVKDIAELAGVSIGTVDRVLHRRGRVAPETARIIENLISEHQFTPNLLARQLKKSKIYRFCALVPQRIQDSGYWELAIRGIQGGTADLAALGVETEIIEYDHLKPASFKRAAKKVLNNAPDGVVFPPIYPELALPFTEVLEKNAVPYSFFDTDLPGAKPVYSINQDSFRGGYLAGKLLHLFIGKVTGPVAVLWAPLSYHIGKRREGFLRYAEEQGWKGLVRDCPEPGETFLSDGEIEDRLRGIRGLRGIFAAYSIAHIAARVVEGKPKREKIFIAGYDMVSKNHACLVQGKIDAIITQRPQAQGRQALLSLYRYVTGQKTEGRMEIPLEVYFKENAPEDYTFGSYRDLDS